MSKTQRANSENSRSADSFGALVGRESELARVRTCIQAQRNILLEGPVGVGKTHLAVAATRDLKRAVFRIDGDSRYSEQKLTGWFDPPTVIKKGFSQDSFIPGPLIEAMQAGGVLFINELNRLPEGVQNVLLPAIDERMVVVPRLGVVQAKKGFLVVATQNPKEFVATSHLSEAILDRFELVSIDYQSEPNEVRIVENRVSGSSEKRLALAAVRLVRKTRHHPRIRRGASVRAALSLAELCRVMMESGTPLREAFVEAALMAIPTRIEIERETDAGSAREEIESLLKELAESTLQEVSSEADGVKKKT